MRSNRREPPPSGLAETVVIGVVAAFVMLKTRSIYPAILVHAAVNAVVVAF